MPWLPINTLERTEQIVVAMNGLRVPGQAS